jgi:tetratricopeptide (TPR) repeat protein
MHAKLKTLAVIITCVVVTAPLYAADMNDRTLIVRDAMQLAHQGKHDEAIARLQEFIRQTNDADTASVHLHLGFIYSRLDQYENALREFSRTVELDPISPMAYYFMGMIYEAKAIGNNRVTIREMERKALEAWKKFVSCADKVTQSRTNGMTREESIKRAQRHILMLSEELSDE